MEGGKTRKFAASEVARAEMTVRLSAEEAKRIYGEIIPLDLSGDTEGRTGFVQRFPLGPVVGIVPFNFPLNLACHKLAPAIAAGNSVILKPASTTPVSSLILGDITVAARPSPGSDQRGALHGCPGRAACPRPPRCLSLVHRQLRRGLAPPRDRRQDAGGPRTRRECRGDRARGRKPRLRGTDGSRPAGSSTRGRSASRSSGCSSTARSTNRRSRRSLPR